MMLRNGNVFDGEQFLEGMDVRLTGGNGCREGIASGIAARTAVIAGKTFSYS